MTRGGAYWLWYYKAPQLPPVPMGVTSGPPPGDVPGLYGVPIGASGAARFGEMTSHLAAEIDELYTRYLFIEKLPRPWSKDWSWPP